MLLSQAQLRSSTTFHIQRYQKAKSWNFLRLDGKSEPIVFWSLEKAIKKPGQSEFLNDEQALMTELDSLLTDSVSLQMQADVPLGAFLSGGIDSSLIVALMQEQSIQKINTFSIGFSEQNFNEAPFAKAVASHLGTNHTELYVTARQALEVIPKLPSLYDEPFADSSQIPTYLVSEMAKHHVTVALSGDAGDELFGGYNRYVWAPSIWRKLAPIPTPIKRLLARAARGLPPSAWNKLASNLVWALPAKHRHVNVGDKIHKAADVLSVDTPLDVYLRLVSHWNEPDQMVIGATEPMSIKAKADALDGQLAFLEQMMFLDTQTYLPDDILVKVDRAAMGVSLETRVPFLDNRVIEAAWKLPLDMKVRNGVGKWCLRELLYQRVPKELIERPKTGFGVPLDSWLRNELNEWARSLLSPSRLAEAGYFNVDRITAMWNEHQRGTRNWQYHLWGILMFEAWRDNESL